MLKSSNSKSNLRQKSSDDFFVHASSKARIAPPQIHFFKFFRKKTAWKFVILEKSRTFALAIRGVAQPG